MKDLCGICAGVQDKDHRHVCSYCGDDADEGGHIGTALVYGVDGEDKRFYCDEYCAEGGESPSDAHDASVALVLEGRRIKAALAKTGVDWRVV